MTDSLSGLGLDSSQLRQLTEHSPDVIMVLDRACRIRFINWTAPGLTVEQVLGTTVFDYVPADQHAEMHACFDRVAGSSSPGTYRNVFQVPERLPLQWESRVAPVIQQDAVVGFTVFARDVSERTSRARELDEFFELSLDYLCIASFDGYLTRINPTFTRLLGYAEQELLSRPFFDFLHPDDIESTKTAMASLSLGLEVVGFENRYRTKSGGYRRLAWQGRSDHARQRVLAVARDVTDQRALEAQLREAQKMDAVGQLAGGIAHDFNNLMQAVLANVELARQTLTTDRDSTLECLAEIDQAGQRAVSLTGRLLAFSRRDPLTTQVVDVNALCGGLVTMLRRLIPENIEIDFHPGPGPLAIAGDPTPLEQVLMNLCVNARDAMPDGGRVAIRTQTIVVANPSDRPPLAPGPHVCLSVEDTGQGMAAEVVEHLFEPFFTTKDPGKGTGLGLSIVYAIVKQHGGLIQPASTLGQGSCFTVCFPAGSTPTDETALAAEAEVAGGTETILVVEDDDLVRRSVVLILERMGYRVLAAASGRDALDVVREATVDLAILDVLMPGLSGPDTYKDLVAHRPGVRVLFTSGYTDRARASLRVPTGHVLLEKPYRPDQLAARVREALNRA